MHGSTYHYHCVVNEWINSLIFDNIKCSTANGKMTIYVRADYVKSQLFISCMGNAKCTQANYLIYYLKHCHELLQKINLKEVCMSSDKYSMR